MSPAAISGQDLYLEIARTRIDGKLDFSQPKQSSNSEKWSKDRSTPVLTSTFSHLQRQNWMTTAHVEGARQGKLGTTTQNHGIGGIFKNLDSANISTFNKSLVANLSVKVWQGLHLSSRHNISFGHLCSLSGHREKECLEIQVRENEASARGVTLKFNLHVHGVKLPVITFVSCVKKRKKHDQGRPVQGKWEDLHQIWLDISAPAPILGHAICTGKGWNAKQMGFVHAHFLCTAKTSTTKTSLQGLFQCLTVSVRIFLATAVVWDGATGVT